MVDLFSLSIIQSPRIVSGWFSLSMTGMIFKYLQRLRS
jgi:hypothetical protein